MMTGIDVIIPMTTATMTEAITIVATTALIGMTTTRVIAMTANAVTAETTGAMTDVASEDHVWFEDRWMVASLCDE
jgi:hypothetical protein